VSALPKIFSSCRPHIVSHKRETYANREGRREDSTVNEWPRIRREILVKLELRMKGAL
jgi:hypothetical protein